MQGGLLAAGAIMDENSRESQYRLRHLNTGRLVIDKEIVLNGLKMRTLGLAPHLVAKNLANLSEK